MASKFKGYSILVVEDEVLILMMIEDVLADNGCQTVCSASTVTAAIGLLNERHFDAAMIDLNLNGTLSYRVADELIARRIPFFFCTGNSHTDLKEQYRKHPILHKPFDDSQLYKMFDQILR